MITKEIDRKITVIFAADVVGYSKHMEKDENSTLKSLRVCTAILEKLFKTYGGRIFNTGGDSVLAEFPSAVEAVECASKFQEELKKRNTSDNSEVKLEYRIGINMGDVIKEKGNLLGDGVNIAARLEALAQPMGITISKTIYDLVHSKTKLTFNDLGVQRVKDNQFHAYDILLDPSQKRTLNTNKSKSSVIASIAVVVIAVIGGMFYFNLPIQESENKAKIIIHDKPSVLVMPFENQTGYQDNDFIGIGITNHIISTLSMNEKLLIPTMNTGKYIQENNLLDNQIKDEYGVQYMLRGSVQGGQGKIRINVQMSDLTKNEIIWSEIYDFKKNEDIFEIQDNLGNSILRQLQVKFHYAGFDHNISRNPEVYKKFVYGEAAFQKFTIEGTHKAEKLWREALELEPDNPRLGQYIGWIHWRKVTLGISKNPKEDMKKAYDYALEALEKNENWLTPLTAVALIELYSGKIDIACSRLEKMNKLTNNASNEISYKALIQHSCDDLIGAKASYEEVFQTNPHHESWLKYMYGYVLTELKEYKDAKQYISEQLKNNFSRAGVQQILYITLAYIHEKEGNKKLAKKMFGIQKENDGKGISADQIHRRFITKKDKSFLEDIIKTFKPYGLPDK